MVLGPFAETKGPRRAGSETLLHRNYSAIIHIQETDSLNFQQVLVTGNMIHPLGSPNFLEMPSFVNLFPNWWVTLHSFCRRPCRPTPCLIISWNCATMPIVVITYVFS